MEESSLNLSAISLFDLINLSLFSTAVGRHNMATPVRHASGSLSSLAFITKDLQRSLLAGPSWYIWPIYMLSYGTYLDYLYLGI